MKDFWGTFMVIFFIIFAGALVFGLISGLSKAFRPQPMIDQSAARDLRRQQQQLSEDAKRKQDALMQDYKQQMRDQKMRLEDQRRRLKDMQRGY